MTEKWKLKQVVVSLLLVSTLLVNLALLFHGRFFPAPAVSLEIKGCDRSRMTFDSYIHVAFFGKYAYKNMKIMRGMATMADSIFRHTHSPIYLHVLLDNFSRQRTARILRKSARNFHRRLNITYYDVSDMANQNREAISIIKKYFFSKDVGRYNDDIFFLSEVFHEAFPKRLKKFIFLDVDLEFQSDIRTLHQEFDKFESNNVIGIAPDLQPQYRMDFSKFRVRNPGTQVGSPGLQGFNTGVVLFDLDRMRKSTLYNSLLNETLLENLCQKYEFHGYLGHQDFFTLTGMEYPELYYKLDCSWNRQLDVGWKNEVEPGIFDLYHKCRGKINILHANGDSLLPKK